VRSIDRVRRDIRSCSGGSVDVTIDSAPGDTCSR